MDAFLAFVGGGKTFVFLKLNIVAMALFYIP